VGGVPDKHQVSHSLLPQYHGEARMCESAGGGDGEDVVRCQNPKETHLAT
jgi:hypothetical protein